MTHRIGNFYQEVESGEIYLLALIPDKGVVLVCFDGKLWHDTPVPVKNRDNITDDEFSHLIVGTMWKQHAPTFKRVSREYVAKYLMTE